MPKTWVFVIIKFYGIIVVNDQVQQGGMKYRRSHKHEDDNLFWNETDIYSIDRALERSMFCRVPGSLRKKKKSTPVTNKGQALSKN